MLYNTITKNVPIGYLQTVFQLFISSSEPLGSQGELIVYSCPGVRPSTTFSDTARPINAKIYMEPPWEGGTEVCINDSCHITKMATTVVYGQKYKLYFSRTQSPMIFKLSVQDRRHKLYKDGPGLTLTYFTAR